MLNISHSCLILTDHLLTLCDDLQEIPLSDAYFSCFTGRSYLNTDNGKYCARYVITISFDVVESASLPMATLNQQAELYALLCVCTLAKDKTANIDSDSKYAFRVSHDFGTLRKQHNFLISSENNSKNMPIFRSYWMQYPQ